AIWITPHVKNTGRDYHGYGAVDFFDTDPHFGTVAKTRELVDKAHEKGLKVLFDIVVNHTGPQHPLVAEKPDWFHPRMEIRNWEDAKQLQEGWIFNLPDFDQSKPEVREYILAYSRFWIEQTGVDGFRIDTAKHVPAEFFTWYNVELQKIKPGFWLIGEYWHNSPIRLMQWQEAGLEAMIDFPVSETARRVFARDASLSTLANTTSHVGRTMGDPWQMGAFLDNHDMARFVTEAGEDNPVARLKLGLVWLFTQRAIPIVYYGTEIAMPGKNDPYNRDDFPWGSEKNTDVRDLITALNRIRHSHLALRRGTVENVAAGQDYYVYLRQAGESKVLVVLNNSGTEPFRQPVAASGLPDGTVLKDELSGRTVRVDGGQIQVDVAARSGAIFVPVAGGAGSGNRTLLTAAVAALVAAGVGIGYLRRRKMVQ
ncbi:MAG TPA: alpha-amylase family glycosyl hydrolase, partial [Symbiobacteriaceae bacterium]|nr:alpha-amylase family glycosyl hydrolase [Symbiobacteriaceae bacterium]